MAYKAFKSKPQVYYYVNIALIKMFENLILDLGL